MRWADQALQRDPASARALETKTRSLGALKQFDAGIAVAEYAVTAYPMNPEFHALHGKLLYGAGRTNEAEQVFLFAVERFPDSDELKGLLEALRAAQAD